jgi:hypothetical protein
MGTVRFSVYTLGIPDGAPGPCMTGFEFEIAAAQGQTLSQSHWPESRGA